MEKMKLIGKRNLNFTAQNGQEVSGIQLYVTHPDEHVQGVMGEKLFVNSNRVDLLRIVSGISVGSDIEVTFNRYGKPEDIVPVSSK